MSHRKINLNEVHWGLTTGCMEIGPGCDSCPAMVDESSYILKTWPEKLREPSETKESKIFIVSLGSDFFQDAVPEQFIMDAFQVMNNNPQHKFQVLTKRSDRLRYLAPKINWSDNIYLGVQVSSKACKHRIEALRGIKNTNKWISMVPLLENLGYLNLEGINSVYVVEESWGPKRKVDDSWIDNIEKQCNRQGVEFKFEAGIIYSK